MPFCFSLSTSFLFQTFFPLMFFSFSNKKTHKACPACLRVPYVVSMGSMGTLLPDLQPKSVCPAHLQTENAGNAIASCIPAHTPHERIYSNIELVNMDGYPIFHRFAAGVPANHPNSSRNGPPRNRAGPVPGKIPAPCTAWLPMLRQQTLPASTGLYGLSGCHAPYTPRQAG